MKELGTSPEVGSVALITLGGASKGGVYGENEDFQQEKSTGKKEKVVSNGWEERL
jgi:hypothetical protein